MEVRDASVSRSFGSFVCFRGLPRVALDGAAVVDDPLVPGEAPAAGVNGRRFTAELGYIDSGGDLHLLPVSEPPTSRCA
jgi:hypothetical protein